MNSEPLMYKNYLQYLSDARSIISTGVQACQVWSAPYDGLNPSPDDYYQAEKEFEEQEVGERDEDERPALTTPPLHSPTPHHTSLSRMPELEWDDSYDAAPDGEEKGNSLFVEHPQPPKHIQEMRKSATMMIPGSYVEESEFQDDVLVYNLVAQRDAQDERMASLKNLHGSQNGRTMQTETNHNTQLYTNSSTENELNDKVQNQDSEEASLMLNGHTDEKKTDQSNDNSADVHQNQSTVLEEQNQDTSKASSVQHTGEDFVSQCLQFIDWDKQSMLGDNVYFQRLTALLYGEETETDFNSICTDYEDDERNEGAEQKDCDGKKRVPFTGQETGPKGS